MKKIVLFMRVSTIAQDIDSQRDALIAEAHRLGYTDDEIESIEFKESGISLEKEDRQGIAKLEKVLNENSGIECLVAWESSRIARRADVQFYVRDLLLKYKVRFIILQPYMEIIDKDGKLSAAGNLFFGLFTTFSENEMMIKKERMMRGKKKRGDEGYWTGGWISYGYKKDENNKIVIDEEEAKVVRRVFELFLDGWSYRNIADEISVYTKRGEMSAVQRKNGIRHIITNKAYIGQCGKEGVWDGMTKYPRIISDDVFYRAQKERTKHSSGEHYKKKYFYYCSSLVYDKTSGYKLSPSSGMWRYQASVSCLSKLEKGVSININLLDSITLEVALRFIESGWNDDRDTEIQKMIDYIDGKNKAKESILLRLGDIDKMIDRANERIISGKISEKKGDEMISGFEVEKEEKKVELVNIENDIANGIIYKTMLESVGVVEDVRNVESDEERRSMIYRSIDKIEVEKAGKEMFNLYYHLKNGDIKILKVYSRVRKVYENDKIFDYQYIKRFEYRYTYKFRNGVRYRYMDGKLVEVKKLGKK